MVAAFLLLAAPAWCATQSSATARLEAALSPSATARRLIAADSAVPRREARRSGLSFAIDERGGAEPEIVVDLERLGGLSFEEAEAEYARALALSEIAAPLSLVETEQASRQWTAQILVETAAEDPALSGALRAAVRSPDPASAFGRAAQFLALFERDPDDAYWSIEAGNSPARETVKLTDLEDLFALRTADIRALKEAPIGRYGELGGRRYPGPLVRAAFRLRAPGAVARLREALGAFDSVGAAPLREAIARWRRSLPSIRL